MLDFCHQAGHQLPRFQHLRRVWGTSALECPTCQNLGDLVAKTSRDWAFAEQLAEVSGSMPELVGPARRKAEAAHQEYDLAVRTLAEHREQCPAFNSGTANGAGGGC